jgi:hypothetical protein
VTPVPSAISAASAWSSSRSVKEFRTTSAPAFANSFAMPSPMPEFEPVMTAVLPLRSVVMAMGDPFLSSVSREP